MGLILVCLLAGCKNTPRPSSEVITLQPLTADIISHLGPDDIYNLQCYISDQLVLFKVINEIRGRNNEGALELTNIYRRDMVSIEGKTKGEIIKLPVRDGEGKMFLEVCFEPDRDDLKLRFVQSEEDGYFNLEHDNGILEYGNSLYQVLQSEKTPRLLINVETRVAAGGAPRVALGRTVEGGKPSDSRILYKWESPISAGNARAGGEGDEDLNLLHSLQERLNQYLDGEIVMTAEELADIEQTIAELEARPNQP
jgi:hypothetical protein